MPRLWRESEVPGRAGILRAQLLKKMLTHDLLLWVFVYISDMKFLTGIFVVIIALLPVSLIAQYTSVIDTASLGDNIIYRKELSGGVIIHSAGWGAGLRKSKNKNAFEKSFWEVDIVSMKQLKEIRTTNPWYVNAKSFVYGKINDVVISRVGFGGQRQLSRKPYWGGVEVLFNYSGGASVGLAKPVYLFVLEYTNLSQLEYDLVVRKYDPYEHYDNIYGRAAFIEGLDEIKAYPGIYGKAGFNFEFGQYSKSIKSLEVGASFDLFPVAIPIMAFNDPVNVFSSFYISLYFGRRSN